MKHYLILAIVYFCIAVAIVMITRENGAMALQTAWSKTATLVPVFGRIVVMFIAAGVIATVLTRVGSLRAVITSVLMAFVATLFFHSGFTLIKTSMPYITPFYADVALAQWDNLLHGGVDPWVFTHAMAEYLPMEWLIPFYLHIWVWPAICLPVIIAATDQDSGRRARTMVLYGMAWVLIGNVVALAGMSGGPVYFDRLYGGDRFGDLTAAIAQTPAISGYFGLIQDDLWMAFVTSEQSIGSGISAFPSVHLSIAMVAALYLWERAWLLGVIGAGFVLVILFLSIYSGYHYALDGYVSIAIMWSAWAMMRRWARVGMHEPAPIPLPAGQLA